MQEKILKVTNTPSRSMFYQGANLGYGCAAIADHRQQLLRVLEDSCLVYPQILQFFTYSSSEDENDQGRDSGLEELTNVVDSLFKLSILLDDILERYLAAPPAEAEAEIKAKARISPESGVEAAAGAEVATQAVSEALDVEGIAGF
jgi:hypothetical protein